MADRIAIRHQSHSKPDLHTDSIRTSQPPTCFGGYLRRMGNHHLVHGCNLATQQVGFASPSPLLDLGLDCDGVANDHDDLELGQMIRRNLKQRPMPSADFPTWLKIVLALIAGHSLNGSASSLS